ncbi:hypothetical protein BIV60_22890 [Bacillus sp. MUM 116]|uniref:hypothetical protein n=1 Tax=Bacillus sp. MUM 116 TaxID=1678002 RepID=UPI0008F57714|nr:hypothetical protein [Bacillus sp. MUM 116]OIK09814.1 hypothetical protein BIV60_22890 [Bacillus sp. MUM 116]
MKFDYERARQLEGQMIRFKNEKGDCVIGKIVKVKEEGFEVSELNSKQPNEGYGFGFFPGPFFGRPFFVPFGAPFFPFFFF